jgi:hypothetical protein
MNRTPMPIDIHLIHNVIQENGYDEEVNAKQAFVKALCKLTNDGLFTQANLKDIDFLYASYQLKYHSNQTPLYNYFMDKHLAKMP